MVLTPDIAQALNLAQSFNRGQSTGPRIPMVFRCSLWGLKGIPPIAMRVNPHSVSFKQGKRITKKNSQGGTGFFHWTDSSGSNNDILEMDFRGRTGNILNRPSPTPQTNVIVESVQAVASWLNGTPAGQVNDNPGAAKHYSWARLYSLTREKILDVDTGMENVFEVLYQSPLFPAPVLFRGHFSKVLDFTESADSPFMTEYGMTFSVHDSMPSLDIIAEYLTVALATPEALQNVINQGLADAKVIEVAEISAIKGSNGAFG